MSLAMLPIDGLLHIEQGLRTAPRTLTAGGVVMAEILSDSVTNWCEFLRELIHASQQSPAPDTKPTGAMDKETALGVAARIWGDPDYQNVIMNPGLADKIACLLMDEANRQAAQQPHAVDASPVVGGENPSESTGSRH